MSFFIDYHYVVVFNVIVKPEKTNGFKWVTLNNIKNEIKGRILSTLLEENYYATLEFSCESNSKDNENFIPKDDQAFRNMLHIFVSEKKFVLHVTISNSRPFTNWTFPEVCRHYDFAKLEMIHHLVYSHVSSVDAKISRMNPHKQYSSILWLN